MRNIISHTFFYLREVIIVHQSPCCSASVCIAIITPTKDRVSFQNSNIFWKEKTPSTYILIKIYLHFIFAVKVTHSEFSILKSGDKFCGYSWSFEIIYQSATPTLRKPAPQPCCKPLTPLSISLSCRSFSTFRSSQPTNL